MIGFFDSGVGGLSILKEAIMILPKHDFIYIGDQKYCPWGERDREFIIERSMILTEQLIELGSDIIVVACNTATVNAISSLRNLHPNVFFVGVEPGIKTASINTNTGKIAILSTKATSLGPRFLELVSLFAQDKDVAVIPAPGLVELIEMGELDGRRVENLLNSILTKKALNGADQLVLGCTHYPFAIPSIKKVVGEGVTIIDTGLAVARQLEKVILNNQIKSGCGKVILYTTSLLTGFSELAKQLMGIEQLRVESILLP